MSSISDAKEQIASASQAADDAKSAAGGADGSIADAVQALNAAASGSGHKKVEKALASYLDAATKLEEAVGLISEAQTAADEYAARLG
jgi:20S proteasome alpha/beta subunit